MDNRELFAMSTTGLACSFLFRGVKLFQEPFVNVAPDELLAGRNGFHDRMAGRFVMFGRVFVLRAITAADVAADQALTQVDPRIAERDAFSADRDVFRMEVVVYLADVRARVFECHTFIISN
jgi:hypothetical protein